jgi:hypothetical protein
MIFSYVIKDYFTWHYIHAWEEIFHVWLNFLWFIIHFFSIPELFYSLFAPWKRMTEERSQEFRLGDLPAYIIINLLSRLVGAILRTIILVAGLALLTLTVVMGTLTYIFWLLAPIVIIGGFVFGISILLSYNTL